MHSEGANCSSSPRINSLRLAGQYSPSEGAEGLAQLTPSGKHAHAVHEADLHGPNHTRRLPSRIGIDDSRRRRARIATRSLSMQPLIGKDGVVMRSLSQDAVWCHSDGHSGDAAPKSAARVTVFQRCMCRGVPVPRFHLQASEPSTRRAGTIARCFSAVSFCDALRIPTSMADVGINERGSLPAMPGILAADSTAASLEPHDPIRCACRVQRCRCGSRRARLPCRLHR